MKIPGCRKFVIFLAELKICIISHFTCRACDDLEPCASSTMCQYSFHDPVKSCLKINSRCPRNVHFLNSGNTSHDGEVSKMEW